MEGTLRQKFTPAKVTGDAGSQPPSAKRTNSNGTPESMRKSGSATTGAKAVRSLFAVEGTGDLEADMAAAGLAGSGSVRG